MKVVDTLYIALGIDPSKLDKGMAAAQSKLAVGLKGMMSSVFAPLLAGATVSFAALFNSITKELSQMNAMSKAYKVNVEEMTAWGRAIVSAGGNIEAFQGSLAFFNKNLTRIALTGRSLAKPYFEAMGIDAKELAQKPITGALEEITKKVETMDKRTSSNLLRGMGFDAGTIKLIQGGTKNLKELLAREKELGVYSAKDAEALTKMNKGFREITSVLKTALIPVFMNVLFVSSRITQYLVSAALLIRRNLNALKTVAIGLALVFAGQLKKAVIEFGVMLMRSPLAAFIAAMTGLFLIFDDLIVYSKGGKSALADFWKMFGTPKEVKKGLDEIAKKFEGFLKKIGSFGGSRFTPFIILATVIGVTIAAIVSLISFIGAIPLAVAAAVAFFVAYWDVLVDTVKALGNLFVGIFGVGGVIHKLFDMLPEIFSAAWGSITETVSESLDNIKGKLGGASDFIWGALTGAAGLITGAFSGAYEAISSAFSAVGNSIISTISNAANSVQETLDSVANLIKEALGNAAEAVKSIFGGAADAIKSLFGGAADWVISKWSGVLDFFKNAWNFVKNIGNGASNISPKLALAGGGSVSNSSTIDNSTHTTTIHTHTAEATNAAMDRAGIASQSGTGVI